MNIKNYIFVFLVGLLLFVPFLGHVHLFDWDEINFAESAREMLASRNWSIVQIDFHPFWEKPPLFIWLQAMSMKIFGVNEFAARLPNAIIGICTLMAVYYVGEKQFDSRFGWLWVLTYAGSFLTHLYFKSGIIDPLFNLFIFLGIVQFSRLSNMVNYTFARRRRISALAGIYFGLAVLTKGPAALVILLFMLLVFWISQRFRPFLRFTDLIIFLIFTAIVSFAWFGLETIRNGPWYLISFLKYQVRLFQTQDAGHGGPFYYHFVVLMLGCFPASFFIFQPFRREVSETFETRNFKKWMILMLVAVLVIFSIVKTKIVHYSSLAYFPITFLAAYTFYKLLFLPQKYVNPLRFLPVITAGLFIAAALVILPWLAQNPGRIEPYLTDPFARAAIHADVRWSGLEFLIGVLYAILLVFSFTLLRSRMQRDTGIFSIFISTIITLQLVLLFIVPKIEGYSQRAAIEFFQSKKGKNVNIVPIGYKTYAHLFYSEKSQSANVDTGFISWLKRDRHINTPPDKLDPVQFRDLFDNWSLYGNTGKPCYFVAHINSEAMIKTTFPFLKEIYRKNGFIFYQR